MFHSRSSCFPMRSMAFYGTLPGYEQTRQPRISWPAVSVSQENNGGLVSRALSGAPAPFRKRNGAGRIAQPGVRRLAIAEPLKLENTRKQRIALFGQACCVQIM